jgi:6-pyruvoyl-tetrahydropterin synthase
VRLLYKTSIVCGHFIKDGPDLITKKCANEHGHTYNFEFSFDADFLKAFFHKEKFLDFALVKELVEKELNKYDHKNITKEFEIHTVEELAIKVKNSILKEIVGGVSVVWVRVFETAKYGVEV